MELNFRTMMLNVIMSVVMILGLLSATVTNDTAQAQTTEMNPTMEAIASAKPYVVSVVNLQQAQQNIFAQNQMEPSDPVPAGTGSGVVYKLENDYAYIVTNHHVIEGAQEVTVTSEAGDTYDAEVLGSDIWTDLAVLRVEAGNFDGYIEFANSDDLVVGETAIAIGSPLGEVFSGSVAKGIVSGLDRTVPVNLSGYGTPDWEANVIQTDAAINPGNSGGALINENGELIGINSMKISISNVEGMGFAIPSNEVEKIAEQLEEHGEVIRPYMGVYMQDVRQYPQMTLVNELNLPEDVYSGVIVSQVEPGSPADQAGLAGYDVIVALDGEPVESLMELRQYLYYEKSVGDTMEVEFYRNGELMTVEMTLE
ncbi:S1C family serine protease [Aliicoccus persicus]|uniref:Serine protease HtrA-like n=1 Tax=Aliicoccus persicus TaxID=930138 RepID=A0A662Z3G6_9STAP|nr:S1C family serine protease [Aliicoccus persicus]SEW03080.1 serine protease Do [Aliicoccus persicus]